MAFGGSGFVFGLHFGRRRAKLAFWRVSAALRKAIRLQHESMLEPPIDTNGNVTPVSGSRSTEPSVLSVTCTVSIAAAAQEAMV